MDPMQKMWVSFLAIGLMVAASFIISFARARTKGIIRILLSLVAVIMLLYAIVFGLISIT